MATLAKTMDLEETKKTRFVVIHPLDDQPEEKVNTESLGPMPMTRSVKFSLMSLRAYLVLMVLLVIYHVVALALGSPQHLH
jgi:hypothetical protein